MENIINELSIDNTETHKEEKVDEMKNQVDNQANIDAHNVENHRSVSAIMQDLQKELDRPVMEVIKLFFLFRGIK